MSPTLEPHEAVHLAHPLAVALGKVVVHGDDVHALAGDGVQIGREDGDERFALAGLHLRDAALVQHDAADELHAEGLHAQHAPGRLAHGGEGLRQHVVKALAIGVALLELRRSCRAAPRPKGTASAPRGPRCVSTMGYIFLSSRSLCEPKSLLKSPILPIPRFLDKLTAYYSTKL